ncbi:MAG: glycosyltransferase family A protein [Candidatus Latescibacterota bacterium]|jgi:glycosyltransferase involved in cell wall biosynthesis
MGARSTPRVTVGLPVYNGAPLIEGTIRGLLAQTHEDLSLVISDNASTDATEEICRSLAASDPRVRYLRQDTNLGAWSNFTFVLEQATTPYFLWAAHDDAREPLYLETCLAALEARPELGIAFTRFQSVLLRQNAVAARKLFPSLQPILSLEQERRLKAWILLDEYSQKANLIYGVWRTELARAAMTRFGSYGAMVYKGLDIALLTYALARAPAVQADQVLFTKQYTDYLLGSTSSLLRPVRSFLRRPVGTVRRAVEFSRDHSWCLEEALRQAGTWTPGLARVIRLKRLLYFLPVYRLVTSQWVVERYLGLRGWTARD